VFQKLPSESTPGDALDESSELIVTSRRAM
jgi:hypothetical protein